MVEIVKEIKLKEYLKNLNKQIKDQRFKEKIENLIDRYIFGFNYNIKNFTIVENNLIFRDKNINLNIIVLPDFISYSLYINDNKTEILETGKYEISNTDIITTYNSKTITRCKSHIDSKIIQKICILNKNLIQTYDEEIYDYQEYTVKNNQKIYMLNDTIAFHNVKNRRRKYRTQNNNIINIDENTYYNDNMQCYNNILYSIGLNCDPHNNYLPYGGEFNLISEEKYLEFIKGIITEEDLFKGYKRFVNRFVVS